MPIHLANIDHSDCNTFSRSSCPHSPGGVAVPCYCHHRWRHCRHLLICRPLSAAVWRRQPFVSKEVAAKWTTVIRSLHELLPCLIVVFWDSISSELQLPQGVLPSPERGNILIQNWRLKWQVRSNLPLLYFSTTYLSHKPVHVIEKTFVLYNPYPWWCQTGH